MELSGEANALRIKQLKDLAHRVYKGVVNHDILSYAAALAFHIMLALFPFLFFLLAFGAWLDIPGFVERILTSTRMVVPRQALEEITDVLIGLQEGESPALLSLSVGAAVWAASGGVRSGMTVLNRVYGVMERRKPWRRYLLSLVYTGAFAILVMLAAVLLFVGPAMASWLDGQLHLRGVVVFVWSWLRYPLILVLLLVLCALAYTLLPRGVRFQLITPGSFVAVSLWLLTSIGFRWYVGNFGRYNVVYGSLGAVVILLLYLYLSSLALLIGGELNAVLLQRELEENSKESVIEKALP